MTKIPDYVARATRYEQAFHVLAAKRRAIGETESMTEQRRRAAREFLRVRTAYHKAIRYPLGRRAHIVSRHQQKGVMFGYGRRGAIIG